MLTEEQRQELAEQIRKNGRSGGVTEEDLRKYPVLRREILVATSAGKTPVILYEYGEMNEFRPVILNFHGGGFIGGRNNRDELFCRRMAYNLNALVIDVDYKLAPEFPYPIAVNECWDIMQWLLNDRENLVYDVKKIILIGHSAGGNLAAGICMRAGCDKVFQPLCVVLDYPPLDLAKDPAEKHRTSCDMPAERAREYNLKYIAPERSAEPFASPLLAPDAYLEQFPDTLIISAGEDSLCVEDEEFALRLIRAGVNVTARRFTDSIHGFVINRMCEWQEALTLMTDFMEQKIKKTAVQP